MTKNKLGDLNNHLFEQLERLNDEGLTDEKLNKEIQRAKAMSVVSDKIIGVGNLALKAEQFQDGREGRGEKMNTLRME